MKLMQLFLVILLMKIITNLNINVPWFLWVMFAFAWLVDVRSQAILENNVVVNGKNIHRLGVWFAQEFGKKEEGNGEDEGEEDVLH